jgi:hypothetical protein
MEIVSRTATSRTLRPLDDTTWAAVSAWRAVALERMPYMASAMFSLRFVDAPGTGTFAVDDRLRCYVDFETVSAYGVDWCAESLLHECLHVFERHSARFVDARQPGDTFDLSNLAADCEIDDDLAEAGCSTIERGSKTGPAAVMPEDYRLERHDTFEHYLAELRRLDCQVGSSGSGQPGQGQAPGDYQGCGSVAGNPAPFELGEGDDLGGAASPATKAECDRVAASVAATLRDAAAKSRGTIPAGLVRRAEEVLAPSKTPWRQVLSALVRQAVVIASGADDFSYSRPSRRNPYTTLAGGDRAVNPSLVGPRPNLAVVRDTSGSMSAHEIGVVVREVEAISRSLGIRDRNLAVLDCDAEVAGRFDWSGPSRALEATGGGGTDMAVGIAAAASLRPRPSVVVVATDGFTPWPLSRPRVPVVVCLVGSEADRMVARAGVPEWASLVEIEG